MSRATNIIIAMLLLAGCGSGSRGLYEEEIQKGIAEFQEQLYMKKLEPQMKQSFIDVVTNASGWEISSDKAFFAETNHTNFPIVVNQTTVFTNPANRSERMVQEQLFILDVHRGEWLKLSDYQLKVDDNGKIFHSDEDIWDKHNDWVKQFRKR